MATTEEREMAERLREAYSAEAAAKAIVADVANDYGMTAAAARRYLAACTAIIAQATHDACEQAAPRVRAEERERVAQAFEAEAEAPEMRTHAKCLRASAAFVRALGRGT